MTEEADNNGFLSHSTGLSLDNSFPFSKNTHPGDRFSLHFFVGLPMLRRPKGDLSFLFLRFFCHSVDVFLLL